MSGHHLTAAVADAVVRQELPRLLLDMETSNVFLLAAQMGIYCTVALILPNGQDNLAIVNITLGAR